MMSVLPVTYHLSRTKELETSAERAKAAIRNLEDPESIFFFTPEGIYKGPFSDEDTAFATALLIYR